MSGTFAADIVGRYTCAPEEARLTSRSPEYWDLHMGEIRPCRPLYSYNMTLDSSFQTFRSCSSWWHRWIGLLQTCCWRSTVGSRFSSSAIKQVMPSYKVRRAAHYMMAMGMWCQPVDTGVRTPLPSATCNACTSCQDFLPDEPMWPGRRSELYNKWMKLKNCYYIPCVCSVEHLWYTWGMFR